MTAVLDAVLGYARRGWPIFPCNPEADKAKGSKSPLTKNGLKDATIDENVIREWWRMHPDALIGLPTGPLLGAFVVDLDPREKSCEALWSELEALIDEPLGDPIVAVTQSGGWHLYFAWPELDAREKLGNRAGKRSGLVDHVDVRGEGGYVIAPPSVMSDGKRYVWRGRKDGERSLTAAPAALVDAILRRGRFAPEPLPAARPAHVDASDAVRRYALAALDGEVKTVEAAREGQRNDTLNEAAFKLGQLVGAGALSESLVRGALEAAAAAWPNPRKTRGTITSGLTAGIAQPRDLSEVESRARSRAPSAAAAPRPKERRSDGSQTLATADGGQGGDGGDDGDASGEGLDPEKLRRCAELEANDTGNGHRLLIWFGDEILHIRDVGWCVWDGKRWQVDGGEEAVSRYAQITARRIRAEIPVLQELARPRPEEEESAFEERVKRAVRERISHARASGNSGKLRGMVEVAATHACVTVQELDVEPAAINLLNGTLRVRWEPDPECPDPDATRLVPTVRLDPHEPRDRISKLMPVRYDPEADCPRWRAFVTRFLPDPQVRWWVQRWHGYALSGFTDAQLLAFNHGLGANGKSTFCEAIRRLMGDYAAALPAEAVTGEQTRRSDQATPEWARLPGVRLVLIGELPRNQPLKEETIKLVTGQEPMLVRHLNKGFFELKPAFKAVMTGNHKPQATGSDFAVWRRLRLVPWTERLEEGERRPMGEVLAEFEAEGAGVLNWLIEGLLGYLADGLGAPPAITAATEEYRADMDPVGEFVTACVAPKPGNEVEARSLYESYKLWCQANAVKEFTERRFAEIMTTKGIQKTRGRVRKYLNIILHDVPTAQEPYGDFYR